MPEDAGEFKILPNFKEVIKTVTHVVKLIVLYAELTQPMV